ncbi:MAG: ABC-2 family transporter protein [Candidatus Micrarchaeia archaeon]
MKHSNLFVDLIDSINLYFQFLKLSVLRLAAYRLSFFSLVLASFLNQVGSVFLLWVLLNSIIEINGWGFAELFLLNGIASLSINIFEYFFSSLHLMGSYIQRGRLDFILVRPRNEIFQILIHQINVEDLASPIFSIAKILIAFSLLKITLGPIDLLMFLLLLACGIVIIFSIVLFISSLSFFFFGIHYILYSFFDILEMLKYPIEIYGNMVAVLFTFVLPFAFASYYPVEFILGKGINKEFIWLSPIVAAMSFLIAYNLFKLGLKRYNSSGS